MYCIRTQLKVAAETNTSPRMTTPCKADNEADGEQRTMSRSNMDFAHEAAAPMLSAHMEAEAALRRVRID